MVTGGASGMGLEISRQLAARGDRVAVVDLSGEAAQAAAAAIVADGGRAIGLAADVADRAAVDAAYQSVRDQLGPIEILVTSAGLDEFCSFTDISAAQWERMIAVNLTGTFHCLQAAVPDMLAGQWGRIVTISSSSAQSGAKRMAHYVASKGGVIGITKALAVELAPEGITVNTIPPGFIDTPMVRRAEDKGDLPDVNLIAKQTPVRRAGTPQDIAAAAVFLCSEEAGYITGQALNVNGGWYL
ncbi:MAG TPA: SDR family NAD(P)-dependent oxidoreductase [Mycobacteriales bacterium]|nr:SDR family NAD(P)-dependent oxidoreductase [Mycobacteriales bacterium]